MTLFIIDLFNAVTDCLAMLALECRSHVAPMLVGVLIGIASTSKSGKNE